MANILANGLRRITEKVKSRDIIINASLMLIPLGFSFIVAAFGLDIGKSAEITFMIVGIMSIVGGLVLANRIYNKIANEEEEQKQKDANAQEQRNAGIEELINQVKAFREDFTQSRQNKGDKNEMDK